jgi:hypothetical protein
LALKHRIIDSIPPRLLDRSTSLEYRSLLEEALRVLNPGEAFEVFDRKRTPEAIYQGLCNAKPHVDRRNQLAIYKRQGKVFVSRIQMPDG